LNRNKKPEPTRIVYVHPSIANFCKVADLAHREPRLAWEALIELGVLRAIEPGEEGVGAWYGAATYLEPATVYRHAMQNRSRPIDQAWHSLDLSIALHVCQRECQPVGDDGEAIMLQHSPPGVLEVHLGVQLVEAAARRDEHAVRDLLHARAHPDSCDARGWTALHAASATRPRWEVLRQLLRQGDTCTRGKSGELACDLSDFGNHKDTANSLKEEMMEHKTGKHLPQAQSSLSKAAKEMLGLTDYDPEASAMMGKRRNGEEEEKCCQNFPCCL